MRIKIITFAVVSVSLAYGCKTYAPNSRPENVLKYWPENGSLCAKTPPEEDSYSRLSPPLFASDTAMMAEKDDLEEWLRSHLREEFAAPGIIVAPGDEGGHVSDSQYLHGLRLLKENLGAVQARAKLFDIATVYITSFPTSGRYTSHGSADDAKERYFLSLTLREPASSWMRFFSSAFASENIASISRAEQFQLDAKVLNDLVDANHRPHAEFALRSACLSQPSQALLLSEASRVGLHIANFSSPNGVTNVYFKDKTSAAIEEGRGLNGPGLG